MGEERSWLLGYGRRVSTISDKVELRLASKVQLLGGEPAVMVTALNWRSACYHTAPLVHLPCRTVIAVLPYNFQQLVKDSYPSVELSVCLRQGQSGIRYIKKTLP